MYAKTTEPLKSFKNIAKQMEYKFCLLYWIGVLEPNDIRID